jgi:hypothetical protein
MCDKLLALAKVSPHPRRQFSPPAAAYANDAIILSLGARKCSAAFCDVCGVSICEIKRCRIIIIITHCGKRLLSGIHLIASRPESNAFYWALTARE